MGGEVMKIEIAIPDSFFMDQVLSAEIGYWASGLHWTEGPNKLPTHVVERPNEKKGEFTEHVLDWPKALRLVIELSTKRGIYTNDARLLSYKDMDASTGDLWIQLAAFGEVRYG